VPRLASRAALLLVPEADAMPQRGLLGIAAASGAPPSLVEIRWDALTDGVRDGLTQAVNEQRRVVLPPADRWLSDEAPLAPAPQPPLLHSALAVPLVIGERALGVLLVAADSDTGPGVRDWPALEELASRAAIAFENARLYNNLQIEIAERNSTQAELLQANQRKDEFLAMLSHELRNPLAPIRNAVEVMRRVAPPDPKLTWAMDVMDRQGQHMTDLVDDLLDVARISQGKIALNRERVDLNVVLAHSVEAAQPLIEARRHQLMVEKAPQPVWLNGDFARLMQVMSNLLNNAMKYSDEGSRIEIRLAAREGAAQVVVRDDGIGIDPALLPHIFELFAQGQRTLDRAQGGLGVGLTVVHRLVELHGGTIRAKSDGPGCGAEFEVTIPCISVVGHDEPPAAEPAAPAKARGARVLIVDDNQDAAESIALFLQLEGHEVKSVREPLAALNCVPVFAPEVVLLDIGLPVMDGYEVARRMRQMPATRNALIVAVSGYGQAEDKQRAEQAGFDRHFVKPTDPHLLVEMIAQWQRGSAARREATNG
jgi:signal transduction histidine kinase/CheY-like chemotaxis protein